MHRPAIHHWLLYSPLAWQGGTSHNQESYHVLLGEVFLYPCCTVSVWSIFVAVKRTWLLCTRQFSASSGSHPDSWEKIFVLQISGSSPDTEPSFMHGQDTHGEWTKTLMKLVGSSPTEFPVSIFLDHAKSSWGLIPRRHRTGHSCGIQGKLTQPVLLVQLTGNWTDAPWYTEQNWDLEFLLKVKQSVYICTAFMWGIGIHDRVQLSLSCLYSRHAVFLGSALVLLMS